jgi:hypothetical protein
MVVKIDHINEILDRAWHGDRVAFPWHTLPLLGQEEQDGTDSWDYQKGERNTTHETTCLASVRA